MVAFTCVTKPVLPKSFFAAGIEILIRHLAPNALPPLVYQHRILADEPWVAGDPEGRREVIRFTSTNPVPTGREIMRLYWDQKSQQVEALQAKIKAEGLVYSSEAKGFVRPASASFSAALQPEAAPVQSPDYLDRLAARRPPSAPRTRPPRRDV